MKKEKSEREGEGGKTEGEERTEEVQTGVRPLQGAGGQQGGGGGEGRREGVVVAMEMTRNVPVAPGCPHRLMGPKPRPVPSTVCHRFQDPKCHLECRWDR